jgi:hypothetical protein
VTDDEAAERRRQDDFWLQFTRSIGQRSAQRLGMLRMLQDERALEVTTAVQA